MWCRSKRISSIMDRYNRVKPITINPAPISPPKPSSAPILSSYIRSPVPVSAKSFVSQPVIQPMNPHRLRVALIGAPNAGKTSLLNAILKTPVGAVSSKANTTRESILGVLTRNNVQIEFVDCPGIVPVNQTAECRGLSAIAWTNFNDCDCALFVVDTVKKPISEFLQILRKLSPRRGIEAEMDGETDKGKIPVILVLNKTDLVDEKKWLRIRNEQLSREGNFESAYYISAKENRGITRLVDHLVGKAVPGSWQFPESTTTTLSMIEQLEQVVRAFLYTWFNKDVPYTVMQQTVGWTERLDGTLIIEHELLVKDSIVARMILGTHNKLITRMKETVEHKLKEKWGLDKIVFLVHVKGMKQRESKRDRETKNNSSSLFSRGMGDS